MKAVFIVYGQALTEPVQNILDMESIRGFTRWDETFGRGSNAGEPHYGSHAWPSKNSSILTIVEDHKVEGLLARLRRLNEQAEQQGLNAYVWNVEGAM
ncbi:MAG: hypothetical protein FWH23_00325 [Bacteroidales bacterium]|nr:hypothetical protein [Bacteroidales bacterium]MCL2132759.1 hypothetical protein [Bacteroidales bacterium]